MKSLGLAIVGFLLSIFCFGQQHSIETGKSIDGLEFGFSTRSDVRKEYNSSIITDTITYSCHHTDKCWESSRNKLKSLYINEFGILFQTDYENQEIVNKVRLYSPFSGKIDDAINISLGITTVEDIYSAYPYSIITSTNMKEYWIIKTDEISFLVNRLTTDNEYPIKHTEIYDRLIDVVLLNPNRKFIEYDYLNGCMLPIFAPKGEKHRNCFVRKHKGGLYYISWGDDSNYESVKNGHWKEYHPNHLIKEEGNYKKGKKIGEFTYYNEEGLLIKTRNHRRFLFW